MGNSKKLNDLNVVINSLESSLKETLNSVINLDFIKRGNEDSVNYNILNSSISQKVEWIKSVYPEIEYLEELIASLAVFNSDAKEGLKSAPGVLYSIILTPKNMEAIE